MILECDVPGLGKTVLTFSRQKTRKRIPNVGKVQRKVTTCNVMVDGNVYSTGTVVKHGNDPDNLSVALKNATQKAIRNFTKEKRTVIWNRLIPALSYNL